MSNGIPVHNSGAGSPNFPSDGYVSPIVRTHMAAIAASNARLAGGANYVSPIVKINLARKAGK